MTAATVPKHVALFGGSFNPIHCGHVQLARQAVRLGSADEVWLMVSPQNPLKPQSALLDEQARLRLARLAVDGQEGVRVSDFEFHLPRPSYTWDTLQALRAAYPAISFSLLIGADNWALFHKWAHHDELLRDYSFIVYPREGYPVDADTLPSNVSLLQAELFPWSSTLIRERIQRGEDCSDIVPRAAYDEIIRCGYYK